MKSKLNIHRDLKVEALNVSSDKVKHAKKVFLKVEEELNQLPYKIKNIFLTQPKSPFVK